MFRSTITEDTRRLVLKLVRQHTYSYNTIGVKCGISYRSVENIVSQETGHTTRALVRPKRCKGCKGLIVQTPCILCRTRKEKGAL